MQRGSDRLQDGFYYFAEPGTPHYPGIHLLGSRDWVSDDRDLEPPLGEWNGPRVKYRGGPPARLPLPILVGDADCISNGENPALPVALGASAFCGKILPNGCYAAGDDLRLKTNVVDCVFGKLSADVVGLLYDDVPAAAALVAEYMGPAAVVSTFEQPSPQVPAGAIAIEGDTVVVWLNGTVDFEQLVFQAMHFGFGPVNQGLYSVSVFYETAAFAVADQINLVGAGAMARTVLIGHSYGGAVAEVLAAKMKIANPSRVVELLTFGAPQCGDTRLIDRIANLRAMHYCNARDPVPFFPPRDTQFAALIPLIGPLLALFWPTFERVSEVRTITAEGVFVDERTDDMVEELLQIASLSIAHGADVPVFLVHKIAWYSYYLCVACKCVPKPCIPPAAVELGFGIQLEGLEYVRGLTPFTDSYAQAPLTAGGPDQWFSLEGGFERVRISTSVLPGGGYGDFTVSVFDRDGSTIFARFDWVFSAAAMLEGVLTAALPTMFSLDELDSVTSLDQLKITVTLV